MVVFRWLVREQLASAAASMTTVDAIRSAYPATARAFSVAVSLAIDCISTAARVQVCMHCVLSRLNKTPKELEKKRLLRCFLLHMQNNWTTAVDALTLLEQKTFTLFIKRYESTLENKNDFGAKLSRVEFQTGFYKTSHTNTTWLFTVNYHINVI